MNHAKAGDSALMIPFHGFDFNKFPHANWTVVKVLSDPVPDMWHPEIYINKITTPLIPNTADDDLVHPTCALIPLRGEPDAKQTRIVAKRRVPA